MYRPLVEEPPSARPMGTSALGPDELRTRGPSHDAVKGDGLRRASSSIASASRATLRAWIREPIGPVELSPALAIARSSRSRLFTSLSRKRVSLGGNPAAIRFSLVFFVRSRSNLLL